MKQIDKLLSVGVLVYVLLEVVVAATLWFFGYQLAASVLLALAALDILVHTYKSIQQNFTPKMRLIEIVNKGGEYSYRTEIKDSPFSMWWVSSIHSNKQWCIENGQRELIRVLEAAIADEKAKIVTTTVVPIDTPPN